MRVCGLLMIEHLIHIAPTGAKRLYRRRAEPRIGRPGAEASQQQIESGAIYQTMQMRWRARTMGSKTPRWAQKDIDVIRRIIK
jgi:hypothetical protein